MEIGSLLIALVLGALIGIVTGLVPGIHVNLVAATIIAFSSSILDFASPLAISAFILSLATVHSFLDTLPSVYLGAPDPENALAVLPSHRMMLSGEGHRAVITTITGAYLGLLTSLALVPLFFLVSSLLYHLLRPHLGILLLSLIAYILFTGKDKYWNLLVFGMSGLLGVLVFSLESLEEPLFPMLSGLFGLSGLLLSLSDKNAMPVQAVTTATGLGPSDTIKFLAGSSLAVFLIQFFPGLGPAQGGVISGQVVKGVKEAPYIAMIGAIGTMSVVFSLVTFYSLGKAKDGSIVAISELLVVDSFSFMLLLCTMAIAGSIGVFLAASLSKHFARFMSSVNYRKLVVAVMGFIVMLCLILQGWLGLLVMAVSTAVGLLAPLKGVARSHSMGCLLLPVLCYMLL